MVVTHDHRTLSYGDRLIRIEDGASSAVPGAGQ